MANKMLQDKEGNTSSKRIIGLLSFVVAAILAVVKVILDSDIPVVWPFVSLAAAILGVSVLERRQ